MRRACVRISIGTMEGCGVITDIDDDMIVIATAAHVLSDDKDGADVTFFDGSEFKGDILKIDDEQDLGYMGVPIKEDADRENIPGQELVSAIRTIGFEGDIKDLRYPQKVFIYDPYVSGSFIRGTIGSPNEYIYELDSIMLFGRANVKEGLSGALIMSRDGETLGILRAGNDEGVIVGIPKGNIAAKP